MAELANIIRGFIRRNAPSRDDMLKSRWLKPFGKRIRRRGLWRFTRRSVPRGVAVGLFVGIFLMIPGLQVVGAALVSAPLRGNIPIAAAMTFLSNPATTPFFILAAINVGNRLGYHADLAAFEALRASEASIGRWLGWLVSDAAPAMVTGLTVIGAVAAIAGYFLAKLGWRWWVGRKWGRRRRRRPLEQ